MNNPFDHTKFSLENGFYFDIKKHLICFYYEDKGEFMSNTYVYNRFSKPSEMGSFFYIINQDPNKSNIEDLRELDHNLFKIQEQLIMDFKWIFNNDRLNNSFIEFLTTMEKYEILELFTIFKKRKTKNG